MKIFDSQYTIIKSWNEEISSLFPPLIVIFAIYSLCTFNINFIFLAIVIILSIPYYRGVGNIQVHQDMYEQYALISDGKFEIQGKVIDYYFGWSYRFPNKDLFNHFAASEASIAYEYYRKGRNTRAYSSAPSNTHILHIVFQLENKEKVTIYQQLSPLTDIPKDWPYIGKDVMNFNHFFKVRSGAKRLRKRLIK